MTGDELRTWRERLGMTQVALAQSLGVTQATIGRWETEARNIEHPLILEGALRDLASRQGIAPVESQPHDGFFVRLYALKTADLGRIKRGDVASIARVVGETSDENGAYTMIVRLYALWPEHRGADGNFGSTLRLLKQRRPAGGFDRRFDSIVGAYTIEDAEHQLTHAVKAAAMEAIPVNWGSLLKALCSWRDHDTMMAWAKSFTWHPGTTDEGTEP